MGDFAVHCHYCNRWDSNLRRCSRCKKVNYCSKVCQTTDWPEHKETCVNTCQKSYPRKQKEESRKVKIVKRKRGRKTRPDEIETSKDICEEQPIDENTSIKCFETDTIREAIDSTNTETDAREFVKEETRPVRTVHESIITDKLKSENKDDNDKDTESTKDSDTTEEESKDRSKQNETEATSANGSEKNLCGFCGALGSWLKCSRCKETFYCSKVCQKQDWKRHKSKCEKKLSEEEERILGNMQRKQDTIKKFQEDNKNRTTVFNFRGPTDRFFQFLTPEQALRRGRRPEGSLARAVRMAKIFFPLYDIVTYFENIPSEPMFPFFPFMVPPRGGYVLVAFMYRYHEHVMRHGVYLKDALDRESKVEFYLDFDNPFPFFSYSQVKPGGYICLVDPVMHLFMDGTVGIRIDNPEDVKVLDIETVMK